MSTELDVQILRRRKALLLLPVVLIPLFTLAFWTLGGGAGYMDTNDKKEGLNLELPDAKSSDDKGRNKLSFYEAAEKGLKNALDGAGARPSFESDSARMDTLRRRALFDPAPPSQDIRYPDEEKMFLQLAELKRQLGEKPPSHSGLRKGGSQPLSMHEDTYPAGVPFLSSVSGAELPESGEDRQLAQLNGMMDKILDIQHPERTRRKLQLDAEKDRVNYAVTSPWVGAFFSRLDTGSKPGSIVNGAGFISLSRPARNILNNALEAEVYAHQRLVNGGAIKLRLLSDMNVDGTIIPKDQFVFGTTTLNRDRMEVLITTVRYHHSLYPVRLEGYDMDGSKGIHVPGAIMSEVTNGAVENATQLIELPTVDPTFKGKAASAGLGALQTLIRKKRKQPGVFVRAGYKLLLLDTNNH